MLSKVAEWCKTCNAIRIPRISHTLLWCSSAMYCQHTSLQCVTRWCTAGLLSALIGRCFCGIASAVKRFFHLEKKDIKSLRVCVCKVRSCFRFKFVNSWCNSFLNTDIKRQNTCSFKWSQKSPQHLHFIIVIVWKRVLFIRTDCCSGMQSKQTQIHFLI